MDQQQGGKIAKIEIGDGRVARFLVPEKATPEEALALWQQYVSSNPQVLGIEEPTLLERGLTAAKKAITGEDRTEGYPELPDEYIPGAGGTAARMSLGANDAAKLDIYKEMRRAGGDPLKDGQSGYDQYGNAYVVKDGKRLYLNAPGITGQDFVDAGTGTVFMAPASRFLGAVGNSLGLMGRTIGSGAGAGIGSVTQDAAAATMGSQQGIDKTRAGVATGLGFLGELAAPILSGIVNKFRQAPQLANEAGELTIAGQQFFRDLGFDPAEVTRDMVAELQRRATRNANPQAVAASAEAASLPVPVPLTRGMQTLKASDQLFENNAIAGAYGDAARAPIQAAHSAATNALNANIDAIAGRLNPAGGGTPVQASMDAQRRLSAIESQAKGRVDDLYANARQTSAGIAGRDLNEMAYNVRLSTDVSPDVAPVAHKVINTLESKAGSGDATIMLKEVFQARKDLSALRSANSPDAVAAGNAVRRIDEELNRLLERDLIAGNPAAVEVWREAIRRARQRFNIFQDGRIVQRLTDGSLPPDKAVNLIFGSGKVFGQGVAVRDLVKMRRLLGAESAEWAQLREAAWIKLSEKAFGQVQPDGTRKLIGNAFAKSLNKEMNENGLLMAAMFSQEERALMQQFGRVLSRVTTPTEGGKNFSNTAPALANIIQNLVSAVFVSGGGVQRWLSLPIMRTAYNAGAAVRAAGSASPGTITNPTMNSGVLGGITASGGTRLLDQSVEENKR
jgi:hypothetical protein